MGAVLCFLPGAREIDDAAKALRSQRSLHVVCAHGQLPVEQQHRLPGQPAAEKDSWSFGIDAGGRAEENASGIQPVLRVE